MALLGICSYVVAVNYVRVSTGAGLKPEFYQFEFGPAVMLACGHGFVSPVRGEIPALDAFLNTERDRLRCEDLRSDARLQPLDRMQDSWKYLMWSATAIWLASGVAWTNLAVLAGLLFAAAVSLTFVLARLIAGPVAAFAVAIATMLSPLHWSQLPHIRDYSKAPFMVGLVIVLTLMVRAPVRPRTLLLLAAAFGLLLGVGYGFRNDLLIALPAFVAAIFVFLPGGVFRQLKLKAAATLVGLVALLGSIAPLLSTYSEGGGLQVVALLGFVSPFDESLRVERDVYEFGYTYSDWYMGAIVRDFARRQRHVAGPVPLYRSQYNAAATAIMKELGGLFPADILARAYASVLVVCTLPVSSWTDAHQPPSISPDGPASRLFAARARMLEYAPWVWPAAVALALGIGSVLDLRLTLFAAFLLLYFGGYPSIQFHERHFFHLNVVPFLALAFLAAQAWRAIPRRSQILASPWTVTGAGARAVAFVVVFVAAIAAPLVPLRAYQVGSPGTELEFAL